MEKLKVSVITPTYKRSEMLPRAIKSVLAQTYKNVEIVVVDDNDPDSEWRKKTEQRMEEFAEYILNEPDFIKKIDIMGIGLDNYTVRESMRLVETYLSNDVLNTIENMIE